MPLNFLLLGTVVLLPFAARLIFETTLVGEPFLIYLGVIAAIAGAQALLWAYAWRARLIDPRFGGRVAVIILVTQLAIPLLLALAGLSLGIGLSPIVLVPIMAMLVALAGYRRRLLARATPLTESSP